MMTAAAILDAIEVKHGRCALIRELMVNDQELIAVRDHCRVTGDYSDYPNDCVWARRIDGLLLDGSGTRTAIEVKISRADFARETDAKRDPWRRVTNRFVYVTPAGLLHRSEVPSGCGLWEVDDAGRVHVRVRARINKSPSPVPHQVLVALAYRLIRSQTINGPLVGPD